jgi:LysR family hydrogen peroxide-inducible transcriptional activator
MNGLTLKHLRYFEALARTGHFGRAAGACAVSQPALSVQIRELENLLGAPLVERRPRDVRLTPLGLEFAARAQAILQTVDDLGDLARAARQPFAGRFRIGLIPTIAPYLLPGLIRQLAARHPELEPRPREAVTRTLLADLSENRLDAAIVALPVPDAALHAEPLFTEEFVLVRPQTEANEPVPQARILLSQRLLLLEEGHCFRDQALAVCTHGPAAARDLMEGSSLSTLVQMVGAGLGVTLLPAMAVPVETRSAPVSVSRLDEPRPSRSIGMVWRRTNPLADSFRRIAETARMATGA